MAYMCTGVVGSFIGTIYLEGKKSANYDIVLRVLLTIGLIGLVQTAFGAHSDILIGWISDSKGRSNLLDGDNLVLVHRYVLSNNIFECLILFEKGMGYFGFTPFGIASLIETSFPLPESTAVTNAFILAQFFAFVMSEFTISSCISNTIILKIYIS